MSEADKMDAAVANRKRTRKSNKSRTNTEESGDDKDYEEKVVESNTQDNKQEKDKDQDGFKRKRKRSRASKKSKTSTIEMGLDPELDLRLSDHGKKAIQYAQLFSTFKDKWKFNKAKQNWLLRNALSLPPADYDPNTSTRKEDQPTEQEQEQEGDNFIPQVFVPVVSEYLKSVLGGAKTRLVESLNEALHAPISTLEIPQVEKEGGKSVSFGDMAMEAEEKEDSTAEARMVELKRQRAKSVLKGMGEIL